MVIRVGRERALGERGSKRGSRGIHGVVWLRYIVVGSKKGRNRRHCSENGLEE